MEFHFQTRDQAKQAPFFFTDEECNNQGTSYGWSIIIEDEQGPQLSISKKRLGSGDDPTEWDSYCAVIARRFSKRTNPLLNFEDLFQEARLKVCKLLADKSFPLARADYQVNENFFELSDEEIDGLSKQELAQYKTLQENIQFRSALKRALLDYLGKARNA
jgi:hypothetical protein